MSQRYYVLDANGNQYGPADLPLLDQWLTQGRIVGGTTLIQEGTGIRILARDIPMLQTSLIQQGMPNPMQGGGWTSPTFSAGYQPPPPMASAGSGSLMSFFSLASIFFAFWIPGYLGVALAFLGAYLGYRAYEISRTITGQLCVFAGLFIAVFHIWGSMHGG